MEKALDIVVTAFWGVLLDGKSVCDIDIHQSTYYLYIYLYFSVKYTPLNVVCGPKMLAFYFTLVMPYVNITKYVFIYVHSTKHTNPHYATLAALLWKLVSAME